MKILLLTLLFLSFYSLNAQNVYIDSLNNRLNLPTTTSEKMKIYNLLVEQLRIEQLYHEASSVNKAFLELAKKEKNYTELTKSYVYQGIILTNQEKYDSATPYIDSAENSASHTQDKIAKAYMHYLSGYIASYLNDDKKAMPHFLKSLSLLEQTKGDLKLEFKLYYKLYSIYTEWNDLQNSKKYAEKSVEAALKSGNKNDLSNAYSAMAVVYTYQYQKSESNADFQSILDYCEKAASLYKKYPGQVGSYTYTIARNNKASYLLEYSSEITPEIRSEIEFNLKESLAVSQNLPDAQPSQAASLGMLSNLAKQDGDLEKAEQYMLQAYSVLQTQNPIYYHIMTRVVSELSAIYEQKGDLKKALEFQRKVTEYRTLLFNQSEAETVKKLEAQYQFEKKEQEVQMLKERAENQRKQKLLYAGLGIVGLFGSFYMFRSYHFRLRYSLEREKQLGTEKNEAELKIKLQEEEQSRLKAEQELMTLKQEKLQNEVMANQLHIQHKNEVLQQLKEKLNGDQSLNINQIIREENLLDSDFEKAKFQIQELHPNFFKTLSEKALQKLTALDLKYCAYFYLGMDTKQIANVLNVEPKSVRMTKYRLKQKFGLGSEQDLVDYIRQVVV